MPLIQIRTKATTEAMHRKEFPLELTDILYYFTLPPRRQIMDNSSLIECYVLIAYPIEPFRPQDDDSNCDAIIITQVAAKPVPPLTTAMICRRFLPPISAV